MTSPQDIATPSSEPADKPSQEQHVSALQAVISARRTEATFACGGQFALADLQAPCTEPSVPPVSLRFGPSGTGQTLQLPCDDNDPAKLSLLQACGAATFGVAGQDVLDESYRKALKLDNSDFCTDFCPYSCGIVAVIDQLLIPSYDEQRSVRAELYKLNVYGGDSLGFFKPHVDTPRSQDQIGSLVVCLPSQFEGGGDLSVRNSDRSMRFNWSDNSAVTVQWAAFYSDCEHEVYEVIAGHRVTLTYNLYTTVRHDLQTNAAHGLNGAVLPFHAELRKALADPFFLFDGGSIGVYLHHMYPHAHKTYSKLLPRCLKGSDMEVWEAARALRVPVHVGTTLSGDNIYDDNDDYDDDYDSDAGDAQGRATQHLYPLQRLQTGDDMPQQRKSFYSGEKAEIRKHRLVWLNKSGGGEVSAAYLAYGNEPSLGLQYSHAALIIQVPSAKERRQRGLIDDGAWAAKWAFDCEAEDRKYREECGSDEDGSSEEECSSDGSCHSGPDSESASA